MLRTMELILGLKPMSQFDAAARPMYASFLNADGSLDPAYMGRLTRVMDRADELGMIIILGIYYFGQDPTLTQALLPGSPALNAGDPEELGNSDQRGVVRSDGVNIGAYQASASTFLLTAPDTVTAGVPFGVIVTAVDVFAQTAVGYTGTVTFSTSDSDPDIVLPADYTFTAEEGGMGVPIPMVLIIEQEQQYQETEGKASGQE
jgi:hypothetical protein